MGFKLQDYPPEKGRTYDKRRSAKWPCETHVETQVCSDIYADPSYMYDYDKRRWYRTTDYDKQLDRLTWDIASARSKMVRYDICGWDITPQMRDQLKAAMDALDAFISEYRHTPEPKPVKIPMREREMYGICYNQFKLRYVIHLQGKLYGYRRDLESAKELRDKALRALEPTAKHRKSK